MNTCHNICESYKAERVKLTSCRYILGQKHCSTCELFMYYEGARCPCCKSILRVRPRHAGGKKLYLKQKKMLEEVIG